MRQIYHLFDCDQFIWEAAKGLESSVTDPQAGWTITAVDNHLNKYMNETILPLIGAAPLVLVQKDNYSTSFRKLLYPEYKSNRDEKLKPLNMKEVQAFLVKKYGAWVATGQEADDLMGIFAQEHGPENVMIHSTDGDLNMVPCHRNAPVKYNQKYSRRPFFVEDPGVMFKEHSYVSKSNTFLTKEVFCTGLKCFYYKLLAGDTADGVKFINGYGPKKAYELLQFANCEKELCHIVKEKYKEVWQEQWKEKLTQAGRVLWVRRKWNQMWKIPY